MRRYHVTTFGCQMNAHDSERIKGLLEELGLGEAPSQEQADVIVLNTCTIREKPDTRFAAHMGNAAKLKRERPGTVVAVGGCYAEAQRERLFSLYPEVDVAFGPGSISHLGEWLGAGGFGVPRSAFGIARFQRVRLGKMRREALVGLLADRARVEDDHVRLFLSRRLAQPELLEHPLDPLGVVSVHLAAEGRDVVPAHDPKL